MKHHKQITKLPLQAQTDTGDDIGTGTTKETLVDFKYYMTVNLVDLIYLKA